MKEREKGLRNLGMREPNVHNRFGMVRVRRRCYRDKAGRTRFLLDEALGWDKGCLATTCTGERGRRWRWPWRPPSGGQAPLLLLDRGGQAFPAPPQDEDAGLREGGGGEGAGRGPFLLGSPSRIGDEGDGGALSGGGWVPDRPAAGRTRRARARGGPLPRGPVPFRGGEGENGKKAPLPPRRLERRLPLGMERRSGLPLRPLKGGRDHLVLRRGLPARAGTRPLFLHPRPSSPAST